MTRIFCFEAISHADVEKTMLDRKVTEVFGNMQASLRKMYTHGWHSYGAGFITVTDEAALPLRLFKGYRGLSPQDDIWMLLPREAQSALISENLRALFAVLHSAPDDGNVILIKNNYRATVCGSYYKESGNTY